MLQLILIAVVLVLAIFAGAAVTIYHFFGAKGLIALPFLLLLFVWIGKSVAGFAFKKFALGLMRTKAAALKGATVNVHSITPVAKPLEAKSEDPEDDETLEAGEADETDSTPETAVELAEPDEPTNYYEVDVTITPAPAASDRFWEPGEFILTSQKISSLDDMENNEAGLVFDTKVWDGNKFGPDDPGKYPGEQRLLLTFAVKPGTKSAWLHYYNDSITQFKLPEWRVQPVQTV